MVSYSTSEKNKYLFFMKLMPVAGISMGSSTTGSGSGGGGEEDGGYHTYFATILAMYTNQHPQGWEIPMVINPLNKSLLLTCGLKYA
jgi:hypothetical protein